ncbi:MAG: hypothetical protein IID54_05390 [Proteobacteria bacterium]|nr:hypothetical protein [Pseudomonadota bacterium]
MSEEALRTELSELEDQITYMEVDLGLALGAETVVANLEEYQAKTNQLNELLRRKQYLIAQITIAEIARLQEAEDD